MSAHAQRFGRLRDLAAALEARRTTPRDLVERALSRIEDVEGVVHAFVSVQGAAARAAADARGRELAEGRRRSPLHGIPFAVKDVIDLAGEPTRAGSRVRADAPPARADATVVAHLKAAGAIPLGKAHTTELAYFSGVPPTRNPHDPARTPGGSSAGSAAAVASGAVPLALGTQTAGSTNRPAAFCGVGAFKPSTLALVGAGITPFAPSFDTVGVLADTAADAAFALAAFAPAGLVAGRSSPGPVGTAVLLDDPLIAEKAEAGTIDALERLAEAFASAGLAVRRLASPVPFARIIAHHRTAMLFELGRVHGDLLSRRDEIAPALAEGIEEGRALPEGSYLDALHELAAIRQAVFAALPAASAIVLPAAPGAAPVGESTGDASFVIVTTALGGPVASVPAGTDASGMPLGALLTMAPGEDAALAAALLSGRFGPAGG